MKYRYLYQTSGNENREGEISAKSREDAFARLRRQGIRPYRLIGDDPPKWRAYLPGAFAAFAAVGALLAGIVLFGDRSVEARRGQLEGDAAFISEGIRSGWTNVFDRLSDRVLAAYAVPGVETDAPILTADEQRLFAEELGAAPLAAAETDRGEIRQLKAIVAAMREDAKGFLAEGGSAGGYLGMLEERQNEECDFRLKAALSLQRLPAGYRAQARLSINRRLRDRGIAPIEEGAE